MLKIWHKPLYKRKKWKEISVINKIFFYLRPLAVHFIEIWLEPLPFPTIFKLLYSGILFLFLMLPIVYPVAVFSFYYIFVQHFIESALQTKFPEVFDAMRYVRNLTNFQISNNEGEQFLVFYIEKCRYIVTAIASGVDYMRLVLTLAIS